MPRSRLSVVTLVLIALMVLVFAWQITLDGHKDSSAYRGVSERDVRSQGLGPKPFQLTHFGGTCGFGHPAEAVCLEPDSKVVRPLDQTGGGSGSGPYQAPWPLSILFGMFMHGGIWGLIFSILFLWIFGPGVEMAMGRAGFLGFYLVAGVVAAYGQSVLDPDSAVPVISAAGAIGGVVGAHLVLYPRARVLSLLLIPFMMTAVEIAAFWIALAWLGFQMLPGVGGVATPGTLGAEVIYLAPFFGVAFGAVVAALLSSRIRDPEVAALAA